VGFVQEEERAAAIHDLALLAMAEAEKPLVVIDVRGALVQRRQRALEATRRWLEALEKGLRSFDLPGPVVDALAAAGRPASKYGLALVHDGLFRDEDGALLPFDEWVARVVDGRIPRAALLEIDGFGKTRYAALVEALEHAAG
jgi:hypothetical protein